MLKADSLHRHIPLLCRAGTRQVSLLVPFQDHHGAAAETSVFLANTGVKEHAVLCQEAKGFQKEKEGDNPPVYRFLLKSPIRTDRSKRELM